MLKYLVVLLDDTSVSYCHYENQKKERKLIALEDLRAGILFAMKQNLMIQFVYPDYELPQEYNDAIHSIDHANIVPASLTKDADVVVVDGLTDENPEEYQGASAVVFRVQKDELYANYNDIMLYCDRLKLNSARLALLVNNQDLFLNMLSQIVFRDYFKSYIFILRVVNKSPYCIRNMKIFQKILDFTLSVIQQRYFIYIHLKDIMNKRTTLN